MQPDELAAVADVVAQAIQEALAPVLERLAVVEAQLEDLAATDAALGPLRERLAIVETKAGQPTPAAPQTDLTAVLERLAAVDSRLQTLGDLRDRVIAVETKAAVPPAPDPAIGDLRDRLTQTDASVVAVRSDVEQVETYASRLEGYTSCLQRDAAALSERVAVVETRAPVPGPAGQDGQHGAPGKDGADGLGFDDLDVKFDGYNMLTFEFAKDGAVQAFPVSLPCLRYVGVHQDGQKYFQGDVTTWAGSTWHCNEPTTSKPGEGSKAWTLMVKRGRDGKDGTNGADGKSFTADDVVRQLKAAGRTW